MKTKLCNIMLRLRREGVPDDLLYERAMEEFTRPQPASPPKGNITGTGTAPIASSFAKVQEHCILDPFAMAQTAPAHLRIKRRFRIAKILDAYSGDKRLQEGLRTSLDPSWPARQFKKNTERLRSKK